MPLINLKGRKYEVKSKCWNCGHTFVLKVPMGMRIDDYLETGKAKCDFCGTDDIEVMDTPVSKPKKKRTHYMPVKKSEPLIRGRRRRPKRKVFIEEEDDSGEWQ